MASDGSRKSYSGKSKKSSQLLSKEEEFLRLNAQLEERTTSLINEAENVLRGQEKTLQDRNEGVPIDSNIDGKRTQGNTQINQRQKSGKTKTKTPQNSSRSASSQSYIKKDKKPPSSSSISRPNSKISNQGAFMTERVDDHHDDEISVNLFNDRVDLANKISVIEQAMADEYYTPSGMNEDVLPTVANEMNPEAVVRFLKAKLRVMQEEMDRVSNENSELVGKIKSSEMKIKEITDEKLQAQKTKTNLNNQVEKWKTLYEESKQKTSESDQEISQLKKEIDSLKRERKQMSINMNTLEVRLNRALEETEKNKAALQKAKESTKDMSEQERKRAEQVMAENKRLERQKSELMNAFKKQMKLIDILRRQKMHIEAAKMLQFTEEEFVKALDWGT